MTYIKDRSIWLGLRTFHLHDADGYNPTGYFQNGLTFKLTRTRVGENNPHWREQVKKQANATTPLSGIFESFESVRGAAYLFCKNRNDPTDPKIYRHYVQGDIAFLLSPQGIDWNPSVSVADAQNDALINFLKHVRQAQVGFSAPTFLGELHQTIDMIRRPALGLRNLADAWFKKVKDLKHKQPKNWKKNLSSAWLEGSFGWQPLISDINSAYNTYAGLVREDTQVPVTGYGVRSLVVPFPRTQYSQLTNVGPNTVGYLWSQIAKEQAFVRYRGMVVRKVDATTVDRLSHFGFNAEEFIPTAWELLPWSFLVDYFSNIGDVITASVACRADIAWVNVSTVIAQSVELVGSHDKAYSSSLLPTYISSGGDSVSSKIARRTVSRGVGAVLGIPYPVFDLPGKPAQWANMTALFAQFNSAIHQQRIPKIWR